MPASPKTPGPSLMTILERFKQPKMSSRSNGAIPVDAPQSTISNVQAQIQQVQEELQTSRLNKILMNRTQMELEVDQAELEARKLDSEAKTMEARSRMQELREKLNAGGGEGQNTTTIALLTMLDSMIERSNKPKEDDQSIVLASMLQEQMKEIRVELLANRDRKTDDDPVKAMQNQMTSIIAIKEMMEALNPRREDSPALSSALQDVNTTIEMHKLEMAHSARMLEIEMAREKWREEMRMKERQIESEERRSQAMGDGFKQLAQNFAPVVQELVANMTSKVPAAMAYASPAPTPIMKAVDNSQPAAELAHCDKCDFEFNAIPGVFPIVCPNCGYTYSEQEVTSVTADA